jgi:eukaryotic-like serine/threonine-protein kinase
LNIQMPPPPAFDVNPRIPESLSELVEKILSREPSRRPVDAEALRRELEEHLERSGAEYTVPAHAPSEQLLAEPSESEGLPGVPPKGPPPRKVTRKTLAVGTALVMALAAAGTFWRACGDVPASPPEHSAPPMTSPLDMSLPSPVPMVLPPATDAGQKEDSTVKMTTPDIPSQRLPMRVQKRFSAAQCATMPLVAALAAGCPGSQIRPESFTCPSGAARAMVKELHWRDGDQFTLVLDDRHDADGITWFTAGSDVVGVVPKEEGLRRRQLEVAPPGTRFYGKAYYLKKGFDGNPSLLVRYDRVKLPGQDERPICFVVEGRSYGFKDGRVQAGNWNSGFVVDRWP